VERRIVRKISWLEAEDDTEKNNYERLLRKLWFDCFGDSKEYEDFYFKYIYPHNLVCVAKEKQRLIGMLHLNPYYCRVNDGIQMLSYIVGVATDEQYRRQGVMRDLLHQSLQHLYNQNQPVAYLMPAKEAYYSPFSFVSTQNYTKYDLNNTSKLDKRFRFLDYKSLKAEMDIEKRESLFCSLSDKLKGKYLIYPIRNERYFDLIYQEKKCQGGDLVFVFDMESNCCIGFFSYGLYEDRINVEQTELDYSAKDIVRYYFKEHQPVRIIDSFSYMIRIVNLERCIELFQKQWNNLVRGFDYVIVVDPDLKANQGIYRIEYDENQICAVKEYSNIEEGSHLKNVLKLSIGEVAEKMFLGNGNGTFFSEVV